MAKWEFKEEREGNIIRLKLLRDGSWVGSVSGFIAKPVANPKYFGGIVIGVKEEHQQEYMQAHNGLKMGEAIGLGLLKLLKREGVSYLRPIEPSRHAKRFVERLIISGIIKKTPEGLLKINLEKIPASEEAMKKMAGELRARENRGETAARAARLAEERVAKMEKVRERTKQLRKPRPR